MGSPTISSTAGDLYLINSSIKNEKLLWTTGHSGVFNRERRVKGTGSPNDTDVQTQGLQGIQTVSELKTQQEHKAQDTESKRL